MPASTAASHNTLRTRRIAPMAARLATIIFSTACATTGATFKSGVGDSYPEHPPYAAGKVVATGARVGLLPVTYQRGDALPNDRARSGALTALGELVADMNRFVDSLGVATRLAETAGPGTPPDVQFGCIKTGFDCDERPEGEAPGRGKNSHLRLAVGRPSKEWTAWAANAMAQADVPNALSITVEIGDYYIRQRGLAGRKEVELGTGYTVSLPWMTGLDTPVNVLQVTGALMNADGTAVRIAAEGMLARRTGMVVGAFGAQEIITEDDIAQLRTARRTDLPGQPLVWQVAVRNLIADLAGRPEIALR